MSEFNRVSYFFKGVPPFTEEEAIPAKERLGVGR